MLDALPAIDRKLYYATHVANLPSIARMRCVVSAQDRPPSEPHRELWAPFFVAKRREEPVRIGAALPLCAFVPLHITPRIPAILNLVTGYGIERIPNDEIVFLATTGRRLLEHYHGFAVATAQPLASCVAFLVGSDALAVLDWRFAERPDFSRDPTDPDKIARAGAEVLVRRHIELASFDEVICFSGESAISRILEPIPECQHLQVSRRSDAYFPRGK